MNLSPIGTVRGGRLEPADDGWNSVEATIALHPAVLGPDAALGLEAFSHIVVVFGFHLLDPARVEHDARHPRGRLDWPRTGILAQRGAPRPNRLGVTTCALLGVQEMTLRVRGLDAVDGSNPVNVKPHMTGFDPRGQIREPDWAREIMAGYW
jgi:tRNA (Thr-GGU) A37 N-methylase